MSTIDDLLAGVPAAERTALLELLKDGPTAVKGLTGRGRHRTVLHSWAATGQLGVRLQTVTVGRVRLTSRKWLCEFFVAVDAARRKKSARPPRKTKRAARTTPRSSRCSTSGRARRG